MAFNLKTIFSGDNSDLRKKAGEAKTSIKDFESTTDSALNNVSSLFGVSMGEISKSLSAFKGAMLKLNGTVSDSAKSATVFEKAMKTIKVAMAATGIGALLVALGSLVAYFTKSQRGADQLARALAPVKQVFKAVTDIAVALGESIVYAFTHPKQAISDLWSLIKSQIVNRFEGFIAQWKAVGKVIKGVFTFSWDDISAGAKEFADASKQVLTGFTSEQISNGINKIKQGWNNVVATSKEALQIERESQALRDKELADRTKIAKLNQEIQDARQKANDRETYSAAERLKYSKEAEAKIAEMTNIQLENTQKKLDLTQRSNALSESMYKDLEAETELQVQLSNLEASKSNQIKEVLSQRRRINSELSKEIELQTQINALNAKKANDLNLQPAPGINTNQNVVATDTKDPLWEFQQKRIKAYETEKDEVTELGAELNKLTESALEGGIVMIAEQFGQLIAGLAKGEVNLKQLFSGILSYLGNVLKQIGSALIAYGVAMDAFKAAFSTPWAAIAAGAALVAAGAVLSALVSSVGKSSSVGSNYNVAQPNSTIDLTSASTIQQSEQQEINVKGTVRVAGSDLVIAIENENNRKKLTA